MHRGINAGFVLGVLAMTGLATAPVSEAETDPCALVTQAEAAAALGGPVTRGESDRIGGCVYRLQRLSQDQVSVKVDEGPGRDRKGYFERERRRTNVVAVPGVGDGAFAFVSPIGFVQVSFRKGDALLDVTLTSRQHADALATASRLAKAGADRLGTSAARATQPGIEAFAGNWHARIEDRRSGVSVQFLTVRPDGGYAMTVAVEEQAFVVADRGQWGLGVSGGAIQGGYVLSGRGAMTTTGALVARWTRVPDGRQPSRVDPALLGLWTGIPLTGNRQPGPLDPGLVGLWEGQGTVDGAPVELVWRIAPAGLSVLTTVYAQPGRLEAADGRIVFLPTRGETSTGTYRFAGRDQFETTVDGQTIRWQRRGTGFAPR